MLKCPLKEVVVAALPPPPSTGWRSRGYMHQRACVLNGCIRVRGLYCEVVSSVGAERGSGLRLVNLQHPHQNTEIETPLIVSQCAVLAENTFYYITSKRLLHFAFVSCCTVSFIFLFIVLISFYPINAPFYSTFSPAL